MEVVFVAVGANLGEPKRQLDAAVAFLRAIHEGQEDAFRVSNYLVTEPVDCPPGAPSFLNAAVRLETSLDPHDLLARLKHFEQALGRPAAYERNSPRPIDLDIVLFGDRVIETPALTVPHPRAIERKFVMIPLLEIADSKITKCS